MSFKLVSDIRPYILRTITLAYSKFYSGWNHRSGLRILMYHSIGTPIEEDIRCLYNMKPTQFREHMSYLAEYHKKHIVPLEPLTQEQESQKIALTFDDGYRDNLTVAAPILAELGIPFTIFICTGAVAELKSGFLTPEDV